MGWALSLCAAGRLVAANDLQIFGVAELRKYECIVPVSGGKDSQACLKMAVKEFGSSNVLALFCDTQFEHPITYQHIENTVKLYGVDLHTVTGGSVEEKILKYGRFPGGGGTTLYRRA